VIGGMAAIGLMGYLLDAGLRMLEARTLKWR
jgi:ABC-type nitrate/sulfonate/bicarbonate transport system permease component